MLRGKLSIQIWLSCDNKDEYSCLYCIYPMITIACIHNLCKSIVVIAYFAFDLYKKVDQFWFLHDLRSWRLECLKEHTSFHKLGGPYSLYSLLMRFQESRRWRHSKSKQRYSLIGRNYVETGQITSSSYNCPFWPMKRLSQ